MGVQAVSGRAIIERSLGAPNPLTDPPPSHRIFSTNQVPPPKWFPPSWRMQFFRPNKIPPPPLHRKIIVSTGETKYLPKLASSLGVSILWPNKLQEKVHMGVNLQPPDTVSMLSAPSQPVVRYSWFYPSTKHRWVHTWSVQDKLIPGRVFVCLLIVFRGQNKNKTSWCYRLGVWLWFAVSCLGWVCFVW